MFAHTRENLHWSKARSLHTHTHTHTCAYTWTTQLTLKALLPFVSLRVTIVNIYRRKNTSSQIHRDPTGEDFCRSSPSPGDLWTQNSQEERASGQKGGFQKEPVELAPTVFRPLEGVITQSKRNPSSDLQWGRESDLTPSFVLRDKLIPGGGSPSWPKSRSFPWGKKKKEKEKGIGHTHLLSPHNKKLGNKISREACMKKPHW